MNAKIDRCVYHICRICVIPIGKHQQKISKSDPLCPESQLCADQHRCMHSSGICHQDRMPASSCCLTHSCKECVTLKCAKINPAIDKAPRNSCKTHPLCSVVSERGKLCNVIAKNASFYCAEHAEPGKPKEKPTSSNSNYFVYFFKSQI